MLGSVGMLGAQVTHADNESSYQFGLKARRAGYNSSCGNFDVDCTNGLEQCRLDMIRL
jgi:hypothetical protein